MPSFGGPGERALSLHIPCFNEGPGMAYGIADASENAGKAVAILELACSPGRGSMLSSIGSP